MYGKHICTHRGEGAGGKGTRSEKFSNKNADFLTNPSISLKRLWPKPQGPLPWISNCRASMMGRVIFFWESHNLFCNTILKCFDYCLLYWDFFGFSFWILCSKSSLKNKFELKTKKKPLTNCAYCLLPHKHKHFC
jgi:hypothetical protein